MKAVLLEENKEFSRLVIREKKGDNHKFAIIPIASYRNYITKRLPKHEVFNMLIFKNDSISGVQIGCERYTNCKLLTSKDTFEIQGDYDRFYNLSEEALIRADKITDYLNAENEE